MDETPGRSRRGQAPAPPEWTAALAGARITAVDHAFPLRMLRFTLARAERTRQLILDPVKAGGNLYLVDEEGLVERRWRPRGHALGEPLPWPEAAPFPPTVAIPADAPSPGMDREFWRRASSLMDPSRLVTAVPDAELLSQLYGATRGDFLADWSAQCRAGWNADRIQQWRRARLAPLEKERTRLLRALARCADDRRALGDPELRRRQADLLAAHLSAVRRGMDKVEVEDLFSPSGEKVSLSLDPAKTPQENLSALYARYAKARRGLVEIERQERQRRERLAALEREIEALAQAVPDGEPEAAAAPAPPRPAATAKVKPLPKGVTRFHTPDGCQLYVGRSADGNDRLVRQILRGHDYWFHVADGTGSHVVLRHCAKGQEPPHAAMLEAARLAHYNSSLRDEAATVVVCVPGKWVRKVKGGPPGKVTYSHPRTFRVDPDPGLFARLVPG
ncbi:fibronectin/fibrinogen-binding protein [bacterium]|nr:fibronectin/fibrinogen-binding protein [bacterium]